MAIVQCNECSGKVSTDASSCPHCGTPNFAAQPKSKVSGASLDGSQPAFEPVRDPPNLEKHYSRTFDALLEMLKSEQIDEPTFKERQLEIYGYTLEDRISRLFDFGSGIYHTKRLELFRLGLLTRWLTLKLDEIRRRAGCSHSNLQQLASRLKPQYAGDEYCQQLDRVISKLPVGAQTKELIELRNYFDKKVGKFTRPFSRWNFNPAEFVEILAKAMIRNHRIWQAIKLGGVAILLIAASMFWGLSWQIIVCCGAAPVIWFLIPKSTSYYENRYYSFVERLAHEKLVEGSNEELIVASYMYDPPASYSIGGRGVPFSKQPRTAVIGILSHSLGLKMHDQLETFSVSEIRALDSNR